jgi:hypothetical protein
MPKFVPAVGWLFLAVGSLMGPLSLATADVALGAKISWVAMISWVAILLGGVAFVADLPQLLRGPAHLRGGFPQRAQQRARHPL